MRFFMVIAIMIMSVALFALDITPPYAQAANTPSCVSASPSPVQEPSTPVSITPGTLFINEILTNPNSIWNCTYQSLTANNDTWIELYNAQNQAIDLSSSHARINLGAQVLYQLPVPSIIAGHGFLVVFPLIGSSASTISSAQLIVGSTVIDSTPTVPTLLSDQSYARIPDGSANWQVSNYPTIGASNVLSGPTPTPTPTKKSRTPHASTTRTKHSSSQGYTTNSDTNNNTGVPLVNDGIQPSWHTLQLPDEAVPSAIITTITPSSATPQQPGTVSDLPKKIIISVSVVILVLALLWCRKLFFSS